MKTDSNIQPGGVLIPARLDWPHAPAHRIGERGAYMVTAGTHDKVHYLNTPERLDLMVNQLFQCAIEFEWELQAWAILANHYHLLAISPDDPESLRTMLNKLHSTMSKELNLQDNAPGRSVWYEYWDSHITFQRSYLARLNYVSQNPVRHGIVRVASDYRWCSAAWFERNVSPAFSRAVSSFRIDRVQVRDDF